MENEPKKEERKNPYNKRVSLFKKRKKPQIRPLKAVNKQRNYKKLILNAALIIVAIFILATTLYIVRNLFLPLVMINNQKIIIPQGKLLPDNNQVKNIILNAGLSVSDIKFATNSSTVTFKLKKDILVLISTGKDVRNQLDLVEAIESQVMADGKRAIYIDLRYNKPIVKF